MNEQTCVGVEILDVIDKDTLEEPPILIHREADNGIKIGTTFDTDDQAYDYYNKYAINKGFSIRKDVIRRKTNGEITGRKFLCSKAGKSDAKSENSLVVRTECKAFALIKVKNGAWMLTDYFDEHNHAMANDDEKHLLRSGRKIDSAIMVVISSMTDAGIGATQTYSYLANEMGGEKNLQFTLEDLNNHIQSKRTKQLEVGDAQSLVNYFQKEHENDPLFSYNVQLDDEGHMTNIFWRDGKSLINYDFFGDVVILDTTYRTNKYGLSCAPFTGINHHKKCDIWLCVYVG